MDNNTKRWRQEHPEKSRMFKRMYKHRNKIEYQKYVRNRVKKMRMELFYILGGPVCVNCRYQEDWRVLCFDHIRDDGREDRLLHNLNGYSFYLFYINNPEIARANLQVLCCNCNQIKKYDLMGYSKDGK